MATVEQVHGAIRTVLNDRANYSKTLNFAVEYCRAALMMGGEDLRVQCLYILGNISRWRHPDAKSVRETLKAYKP
jgi:hypothetical protein